MQPGGRHRRATAPAVVPGIVPADTAASFLPAAYDRLWHRREPAAQRLAPGRRVLCAGARRTLRLHRTKGRQTC